MRSLKDWFWIWLQQPSVVQFFLSLVCLFFNLSPNWSQASKDLTNIQPHLWSLSCQFLCLHCTHLAQGALRSPGCWPPSPDRPPSCTCSAARLTVLSTAARVSLWNQKSDHVSPRFQTLKWLHFIQSKRQLHPITYRALPDPGPETPITFSILPHSLCSSLTGLLSQNQIHSHVSLLQVFLFFLPEWSSPDICLINPPHYSRLTFPRRHRLVTLCSWHLPAIVGPPHLLCLFSLQ